MYMFTVMFLVERWFLKTPGFFLVTLYMKKIKRRGTPSAKGATNVTRRQRLVTFSVGRRRRQNFKAPVCLSNGANQSGCQHKLLPGAGTCVQFLGSFITECPHL